MTSPGPATSDDDASAAGDASAASDGGAAGDGARPRPPLALIFAVTVTGILGNALINPPLPDILHDFGEPDSHAGWVVSAATAPGIFLAPIIGLMADRFGRRAILVPCLAVFGVFGWAAAFAPTFPLLLVCRLGQGVGSAGLVNLAVVLIGDHWDGLQRARLIGLNSAVLTGSITVLPAVGGGLAQWGGWRWSFAPYGASLVVAGFVWRTLRGGDARPGTTFRQQLSDTAVVLRLPAVWLSIAFGFVLFGLIFGLFFTVMPLLLERSFDLEAGLRGVWLAVPALGSTTAALMLARTRARLGSRVLLLTAVGCMVAGFGTIGLALALPLLFGGLYLYGLGEGSMLPTLQDIVSGSAPAETRGAVIAVFVGVARAGQTLGPLVCGAALAVAAPRTVFLGGAVVAAVLGAALVATGPHLAVDQPADRPVDPHPLDLTER